LGSLLVGPSRDFDLLVFPEVREVEEEDGPGVVDEERRESPELDDIGFWEFRLTERIWQPPFNMFRFVEAIVPRSKHMQAVPWDLGPGSLLPHFHFLRWLRCQ